MENLRPILSGLAGALIAGMLLRWAARGTPTQRPAGHFAHGARYRAVAVAMLLVGCFIAYAAMRASASQKLVAFLVAAPLFTAALWMTVFSPWQGWRSIPLSSIIAYRYSLSLGCHVLTTQNHGRVRLSSHMEGVDQVAERLSSTVLRDAA